MSAGHVDGTALMRRALGAAGGQSREEPAPVRVRFVADLVCPWCYLGFRRLSGLLAARPVEIAWQPFLLNPYLPPQGVTRRDYLERKFGSLVHAQSLHRRIAELGAAEGVRFAFAAIRQQPSTVRAHALLLAAAEAGQLLPAAEALFRAFFAEGADLGDEAALARIAAASLPADLAAARPWGEPMRLAAVAEAHEAACRLGINGVPVTLFGEEHVIAGAQPPEALAAMLDIEFYRGTSAAAAPVTVP